LLEVFPDGQKVTEGFKKYAQVLTLLPDDYLIHRLEQKAEIIKTSTLMKSLEKAHYEILLITNELDGRKLI